MRVVPERGPWAQVGAVLALMIVGPLGALRLALAWAPESDVVQVLAPLAFAAVLVGGLVVWMGVGIVWAVGRFLWRLLRGRSPWGDAPLKGERLVPPGYRAFPVLGVLLGGVVGLLAGILTDVGVPVAVGTWSGAGAGYGALLWAAARTGLLPFPEPE